MKILVTGRGTSGSFQIRGQQLGTAIGAKVEANATDYRGYDVAILVKRPRPHILTALHDAQIKIVWDIVDSHPQPHGNDWDRATCLAWLRAEISTIRPNAIVAATQAMAADCAEFGVPVLALPHHARPGLRRNALRERVQAVGYEGGLQYLGRWHGILERECADRGWTFQVDPAELAGLDIVVALRQAVGYAPRTWKSNVKLANAQGSGTPSIVNRECGYTETANSGQHFADTEAELHAALDALTEIEARRQQVEQYQAPTLEVIAKQYREWLHALR